MTDIIATFNKAFLQRTSCSDEGMQLEILAGGSDGSFVLDRPEALARILADDNEFQWFEFFAPEGRVRVPVSEIERAISAGKADVHGEAWYDKQLPEA
jgi:hypothetical protein